MMDRNSIRLIIILATICIVGIVVTQIFWVKKAFDIKETQFNVNVSLGLKNVADSIAKINHVVSDTLNPVNQLSSNYFAVNIKKQIDPQKLERLLKKEFIKRGLLLNFGIVIYNDDRMVYGKCISFNNTGMDTIKLRSLPNWKGNRLYFGIYFPTKDSNMASQMSIWIFSSSVLLVVIVFFAYTLYIILKQKRLSEIQRDFVNNMTHEFQTPISSILISSAVLQDPDIVNNPNRLKQYASLIGTEINKLRSQVERVLEMSSMENDQLNLNKEIVNLHDIISLTATKITQASGIAENCIWLDLQAICADMRADRIHMENIIYNLIDNAIKYSGEVTEVKISTRNERNGIIINVVDKGIGIHADQMKHIFKKFYRVPTGNLHDIKGFGLGLSYVSLLTKAHNGVIDVYSKPGNGSEFILFFPIV
jgi:two-component system phosphate regulon sensor histidine kinase PhoR